MRWSSCIGGRDHNAFDIHDMPIKQWYGGPPLAVCGNVGVDMPTLGQRWTDVDMLTISLTWLIGYNINVLQQTACLVVNPITVGNFAFPFIARRWVGLQTLWWFRLKDLSIDEMVGAWCFGCLSGPPGFTCWISFAPLFSLIYCWVLILALSPCYILIYMF